MGQFAQDILTVTENTQVPMGEKWKQQCHVDFQYESLLVVTIKRTLLVEDVCCRSSSKQEEEEKD